MYTQFVPTVYSHSTTNFGQLFTDRSSVDGVRGENYIVHRTSKDSWSLSVSENNEPLKVRKTELSTHIVHTYTYGQIVHILFRTQTDNK